MATLQTTLNPFARGHTRLDLTPNSPIDRALVDTYQLRLTIHDRVVYDRRHSVRNWQSRHFYVEQLAKACQCVPQLLDQHLPCDPEDNGYFPVCAQVDTDWLALSLSAASTKLHGALVGVRVYVQQAKTKIGDTYYRSRGQWGEWDELIGAVILCTPADAVAFGTQLLDEIRAVEATREALGIPETDEGTDPDDGTEM